MTDYFITDQYTRVTTDCPMATDLHPADDSVEIILGAPTYSGDALRLVFTDMDLLLRLIDMCDEARGKLIQHHDGTRHARPKLSLVDPTVCARIGSCADPDTLQAPPFGERQDPNGSPGRKS